MVKYMKSIEKAETYEQTLFKTYNRGQLKTMIASLHIVFQIV